jgi:steroid delta-isomerase-like uncharacterized protein
VDTHELVERFLEAWNAKDQAAWSAMFADEATLVAPGGVSGSGPEAVSMFYRLWQDAFPDNRCRAVRIVGDDSSAVLEAVFEGTHTETLHAPTGDVPATGRRVDVPFVNVCGFDGERMTDFALYFDQVELMTQLGLVPAPA